MPRLMSVALTEQAVVDRTKTVTRRLGWEWLEPGTRLTLCRKVMGRHRRDGSIEPLVRLADVEVTDVRREPLHCITPDDIGLEGLAPMNVPQFVRFFCNTHKGVRPGTIVTRIEWRYLDGDP